MPSFRDVGAARRATPAWQARARRNGVEYHLGYFATLEEAIAEEDAFREWWPPGQCQPRRNAGEVKRW